MRSTFIALLSCMLFVGVCVAPAMADEKSEGVGALLAVRSLDVAPMTEGELDQVVGAADIAITFLLEPVTIQGVGFAFDFRVVGNPLALSISALDVLATVGPLTFGASSTVAP